MQDQLIASSPCKGIRLPKQPPREVTAPSTEQVERLIAAMSSASSPPCDERYRAMVVLARGTGLRQGEAFGLALDRVDFLRRTLRVDQQVTLTKAGALLSPPKAAASHRTIPLPQVVVDALAVHLA